MLRKQIQMIVTVSVPVLPYHWRLTPKLNAEGARREVRDIVKTGSGHLYNVGDELGVRLVSVKPFDEKAADADRKQRFELVRLLDFVVRWLSPARGLNATETVDVLRNQPQIKEQLERYEDER